MTIRYVEGDILTTNAEVLAHGVACGGMEDMGTGLAKSINQTWPESFREFKKYRRSHGFKPGEIIVCENTMPSIAYLATQPDLYRAKLSFLRQALRNLRKYLEESGVKSCAIPKIGCGYGKLPWEDVEPIILEKFSDLNGLELQIYSNYIPPASS